MKKIIGLFISILFVSAIILVTFLGVRAEVNPSKNIVEVQTIVLDEIKGSESKEFNYHYDGSDNKSTLVYTVLARPFDNQINALGEDSKGNVWNMSGIKFQYIVKIMNFQYIYDTDNWISNQKKGTYQIRPSVIPENSTIQEVTYSSTIINNSIELSDKGLLTFKEKTDEVEAFTVTIKATDNSNTSVNIRFLVNKYNPD